MARFIACIHILVLVFLFAQCKEEKEERQLTAPNNTSSVDEDIIRTFYNIPSPSEQLNQLRVLDGKKLYSDLLSTKDVYLYNTTKKRLFVFGAYAADASYLASKSQTGEIVNYLAVLETLSRDLGLRNLVNEDLLKTLTQPNKSADSLFIMADQFYLRAFDRMIESNKGADLGMILYGGWLETMFISLQSSYGYENSSKINQFLADQKLVAENLISYLLDYQDSDVIFEVVNEMASILDIYENMDCNVEETKVVKEEGKITLNGGTKCKLTKQVFLDLKSKINVLRNTYTK